MPPKIPDYPFGGADGPSSIMVDVPNDCKASVGITEEERIDFQTIDEWVQENKTKIRVWPAALILGLDIAADGLATPPLPDDWDDRIGSVPPAHRYSGGRRRCPERCETDSHSSPDDSQIATEPSTWGDSLDVYNSEQVGLADYPTRLTFQPNDRMLVRSALSRVPQLRPANNTRVLQYDHHRTANFKAGSLVLSFVCKETNDEVVAFFNIDTKRQRGPKKGCSHRLGIGGKFWPLPRSAFRKFWSSAFGNPTRWAAIHKELRPRMKGQLFTADVDVAYKKDRTPFLRAKNLRILEQD